MNGVRNTRGAMYGSMRSTAVCSLLAAIVWGSPAIHLAGEPGTVPARVPEAVPVDGLPFPASLLAVDTQWQITLETEGASQKRQRKLNAADLVAWGQCVEARRAPLVVFPDGGLLAADVFEADREKLSVDSPHFGLITLPLDLVAGVVFHLPNDPHARDMLPERVASDNGASDLVILTSGDEVAGRIDRIGDDVIRLDTDLGPVAIEMARASVLVFNPALLQPTPPKGQSALVALDDGSRLRVERLVVEGDTLEVDLVGGARQTASAEALVGLQPLGGRVEYLSDKKPADYRHLPFLNLPWPYKNDRNVAGGRLRTGGRLYSKGLGMHSAARLTYLLDEPYGRFQAELGIDDSTAGHGSVAFRVFVDGKPAFVSGPVRGRSNPVPVSVDLVGAKRLDLVVDYGERADELDRANWLDARLVRP